MKIRPRIALLFGFLAAILACNIPSPSGPAGITVTRTPTTAYTPTATPVPGASGQIAYGSDRGGKWQIVLMELDSGTETSLTGAFTGEYSRPAWSPDGGRLALREEITMDGGGVAVMDVGLQAGRPVGSQPGEVFHGFSDSPTWTPDGTRIAFVTTKLSQSWQAFSVPAAGGAATALPGIPAHANDLAWSPDGDWIAFSNYTDPADQADDIFLIHPDGTGLMNLTNTPNTDESEPAWSPDGTQIAFAQRDRADRVGEWDIYRMNRDGGGKIRITTDPASEFDPAWSPDGTQIAFTSTRDEVNDGNYEIYLINADGSGELRLTNNRSTDRWPTWRAAPAGTIAPSCETSARLAADVTVPAGTQFAGPRPFTKIWRIQNSGTCAWPPAGFALRFSAGEPLGGALQVPIAGAVQPGATFDLALPLAAPDAPGGHEGEWIIVDALGRPIPALDGNPLILAAQIEVLAADTVPLPSALYFLSMGGGSTQIWRLESDGRTAIQITNEPQPVTAYDVSPADGSLAYVSGHQLFLTDRGGSNRRVAADFGVNNGGSPVWAADGSRLAYAFGGIHLYEPDTGVDRLLIENHTGGNPGAIAVYSPVAWSPDGNRLLAAISYYEGAELGILSIADGSILARGPLTNMNAWRNDSRAVYLASASYPMMVGMEPGLMLLNATGEGALLVSNAFVWWPYQRSDGALFYFVSRPAGMDAAAYLVQMVQSAADGSGETAVRDQTLALDSRDIFLAVWTGDAGAAAVAIRRPVTRTSEVLMIPADDSPPVFLMQDGTAFHWEL